MLQVFESHCEYLSPQLFEEFALPYIKEIQERVRAAVNVPMVMETLSFFYHDNKSCKRYFSRSAYFPREGTSFWNY